MSQPIRVVGIGGSLNPTSTSQSALAAALVAARNVGALTELFPLRDLRLPFYEPEWPLSAYPATVEQLLSAVRQADVLLLSTPGYHGTLAGVTKNALDFLEFLHDDHPPYLTHKLVGLIATAGGEMAAVNAINALAHVAQSLRGVVIPLHVPIARADQAINADGQVIDGRIARRLQDLGTLAVELASRIRPEPRYMLSLPT